MHQNLTAIYQNLNLTPSEYNKTSLSVISFIFLRCIKSYSASYFGTPVKKLKCFKAETIRSSRAFFKRLALEASTPVLNTQAM